MFNFQTNIVYSEFLKAEHELLLFPEKTFAGIVNAVCSMRFLVIFFRV